VELFGLPEGYEVKDQGWKGEADRPEGRDAGALVDQGVSKKKLEPRTKDVEAIVLVVVGKVDPVAVT